MWNVVQCDDYLKQRREFTKKWREEMMGIATNSNTVLESLGAGSRIEQLRLLGFVHSEGEDLIAIDETGCGKKTKPKALRLYLFIDADEELVHVIRLGEKSSKPRQSRDIDACRAYILRVRTERAKEINQNTLKLKNTRTA